jgi:hypothetical protein
VKLEDLDVALDGATLLDALHDAFTKFVVLPSAEAEDAVVLWTVATHGQPAWEHATRLNAFSPERRCGKSRLLDIIEATCYAPLITVNISAAALARSIGTDSPTIILDEADAIFGNGIKGDEKAETIRGLINAGHQRNRPYIRWNAAAREAEHCNTFAMTALAGIGALPDTITDRSVVIRMQRRAPGEKVSAFRTRRDTPPLHDLRDRLTAWVRANLDELREAEPTLPVDDRAADNWTSLAAIADLAGGGWPERARQAAEQLTTEADQVAVSESLTVRLLEDLHGLDWTEDGRLPTSAILFKLGRIDESPWASFGKPPRPINPRDLAKMLRGYGVGPKTIRLRNSTPRGYERADLESIWQRYLPSQQAGEDTVPTGESQHLQQRNTAGQEASSCCTVADVSATPQHAQASDQQRFTVADVADTPPARSQVR